MNFIKFIKKNQFRKTSELDHTKSKHRSASPLELFIDLAFVAAFATLVHFLIAEKEITSDVIFGYVLRFASLFGLWLNTTWYNNMFESQTLRHRMFMFIIIFLILIMQASFSMGNEIGMLMAVLGYSGSRYFQAYIWYDAGRNLTHDRKVATHVYVYGSLIAGTIAMIMFFVFKTVNYPVWALTVVVELLIPTFVFMVLIKKTHKNGGEVKEAANQELFLERFGLIFILALGEGITAVSNTFKAYEYYHDESVFRLIIGGAIILLIAYAIWEIYFDVAGAKHNQFDPLKINQWILWNMVAVGTVLTVLGVSGELVFSHNPDNIKQLKQIFAWAMGIFLLVIPRIIDMRNSKLPVVIERRLTNKVNISLNIIGTLMIIIALFATSYIPPFAMLLIGFGIGIYIILIKQFVYYQYIQEKKLGSVEIDKLFEDEVNEK